MKRLKSVLILLLALGCAYAAQAEKIYRLTSPDGRLQTCVSVGERLTYDLSLDGRTLLLPSQIGMQLADGRSWGANAQVRKAERQSVDLTHPAPFYRSNEVHDRYNALTLRMKGGWSVEFRAYDDGVAYRFATTADTPFAIAGETVEYRFPDDFRATVPYVAVGSDGDFESQFGNSFENTYTEVPLSELNAGRLAFLPLAVDAGDGVKLCLTESDLNDYPGLYLLNADGGQRLEGRFAGYPKHEEQGGHNNLQMIVTEREAFIAKIDGRRTFPWRVAVAGGDTQIAASDLSWLLAEPSRIEDTSWIRPGKVAWDWWNDWNLSGVDFRTGINTETYKYYIDFAADKGIEYVILDEGWAVNGAADLMQVVPEIDLKEIIGHAAAKQVGIILWAGYLAFDRDMENVCRHYSEMGVKGFKVDFMDRDDQPMTAFNHRAAATAAKYGLLLDLHGTHKPAGLNRTWPNVLNFEGVHGLEQMKWSPATVDQMRYDATLPYIRQVAGAMDYTQGAMLNAAKGNYHPCYSEPMSQGTRCHQLALYVVLDSPLNMLCDSPTNYLREPECTEFIAAIPTVWDETRILDGRMGEYIVTARRKGDTWYVGGITDWTPRRIEVDLTQLGITAPTRMTEFSDGANADRKATDFSMKRIDGRHDSESRDSLRRTYMLAPGGGFVLKIEK